MVTPAPTNESLANFDRVADVEVPNGLFIDGVWRASSTGARFEVENPATGWSVASIADASDDDALDALASASAAQEAWGHTSSRHRAEILRNAFNLIQERRSEFAAVVTAEMGKPLAESMGEVNYGAEFFRWFSEQATQVHGDFGSNPAGEFRIITTKVPVGPSLLITPWNFPLAMGTRKIGAALAAGCTVILKPAAQTPLTAALLIQVLVDAGVPSGVVNFIPTTDAASQSRVLMADARLRKVSFTGSTGVGSTLLHQAADNVLRTSMELGGNGPFIILEDANIDAAVEGAMLAKFRNGGQSCVAANRFIVHAAIAERFTQALAARARMLVTGNGVLDGVTIGPLIDGRQRARVQEYVAEAISAGARVVCGAHIVEGDGYFYEPTVLADVPVGARISSEEIFGPVATITVARDYEHAIALANDTPFGLAAFLYTRDVSLAFSVAERLEVGMVGINRGLVSEAGAPFGGMKASGLGREGGQLGIEEYLETKYFALSLS